MTKLKNPILFLASLLPLSFLAGCEYGPKRPETKHLTIDFNNEITDSSGEKCFYADNGDYFWFSYDNLSAYQQVASEDGFSHFDNTSFFQNKTAFNSIVRFKVTFSKAISYIPVQFGYSNMDGGYNNYYDAKGDFFERDFYNEQQQRGYYYGSYPNYFNIGVQTKYAEENEDFEFDVKSIEIDYISADYFDVKNCEFKLDVETKECCLTKCATDASIFSIPSKIGEYPVTSIGEECFRENLWYTEKHLKRIIIPNTIKTIGKSAFQGLRYLENVTFEKGSVLETIEDNAFADCVRIDYIIMPKTLKSLSKTAFSNDGRHYYYDDRNDGMAYTKLFFSNENIYGWADRLDTSYYYDDYGVKSYFGCNENNFVYEDNVAYYDVKGKVYVVDVVDSAKDIKIKSVVKMGDKIRSVCGLEEYCFMHSQMENLELGTTIRDIKDNIFDRSDELKKLNFNIFGNGRYVGNPANPYMVFTGCINNNTKVVFHDKAEIIVTPHDHTQECLRMSYISDGNVRYIPSESNPYFACYGFDEETSFDQSGTAIISGATRAILKLNEHYNHFYKIILPSNLVYFHKEALLSYENDYEISASNQCFETVNGSLYDVSGEALTLLHLSFYANRDPSLPELESISVANGTTHVANGAIKSSRKILLLPESLYAVEDEGFYCGPYIEAINIPANLKYLGNLPCSVSDKGTILVSSDNPYYAMNEYSELVSKDGTELYHSKTENDGLTTIISPAIKKIHNNSIRARNIFISNNVEIIEKNAIFGGGGYSRNIFAILEGEEKPGFAKGWDERCAYVSRNNSFVKDKDGVIYTLNENGEAIAMSYWKTDIDSIKGSIVINGTNYSVVEIGADCFMGENFPSACFTNKRVVIPNSVKTINYHAFVWFNYKNGQDESYIFVPKSVQKMIDQVFFYAGNIHCEAQSKPEGWSDGWQHGCNVTFGCTE